jgi:hypothetical protein
MYRLLFVVILILGCTTRQNVSQDTVFNTTDMTYPIDSMIFQNPILDFNLENNQFIVVLDFELEKIFKFNLANNVQIETISLSQKLYFIKSLAVDNFYIYLYGDNVLYRYDPNTENLFSIIQTKDQIKISDLSITSEGEIFISDGFNYKILLVNSLGQITEFRRPFKELFIPMCVYYDNVTSKLWVINQAQSRIEVYSRIGNLDSIIPIPERNYSKIAVDKNYIYLLSNNNLIQLRNRQEIRKISNISDFKLTDNLLLTLQINNKIFYYPK